MAKYTTTKTVNLSSLQFGQGSDFSGTACRPPQIHNLPSHSSKTVLSIVKIGPHKGARTLLEDSGARGSQSTQPKLENGSVYRARWWS